MKRDESGFGQVDPRSARRTRTIVAFLGALLLCLFPAGARGDDDEDEKDSGKGACSSTARVAFQSCEKEAEADYALAIAKCVNIEDATARNACAADARSARGEAETLCHEQRQSRSDVCAALGEARYDPTIHPGDFETD